MRGGADVVDLTGDENDQPPAKKKIRQDVRRSLLPFQLLRTRGIPPKFNDERLGLGFDMMNAVSGDVRLAFVSNYLIDPVFLVSSFPDLLFCDTVIVAHGMKDLSQHEMLRRSLRSALVGVDVEVVAPEVPPYGTHHSKLFLLQYERGIRIIIHTANLVYCDFNNKSQAVFMQDFPRREAASVGQDGAPALPNDFEAQLLTYVDHLGLSTSYAAKLKAAISAHEYTYARGRLAGSVPSKPWQHQGAELNAFGHHRVREILADEEIDGRFRDAPVVAQCSSLGTMSEKYVAQLLESFAAASDTARFQLIWPSVSQVQHSLEGWFGGGSVCVTKDRLSKPVVQARLHAWGGEVTGRQRALPHMKTFLRYAEIDGSIRLPWVFLTSSNCSKAALGEAVNSKKYGATLLRILSFEMGIVLLPRYELAYRRSPWYGWSCTDDATPALESGSARDPEFNRVPDRVHFVPWSSALPSEQRIDESTLLVPIPIPFSLPPRPYPDRGATGADADDLEATPWFGPDTTADVWKGRDILGNLYPGKGTYQGLVQRGTPETLWQDLFAEPSWMDGEE